MIRKALAVLVILALPAAVRAGESDYWVNESGTVKKVLDFVAHNDGKVYGATHDSRVFQRTAGTPPVWAQVGNIEVGLPGLCMKARRGIFPQLDSQVLPKIISFKGKLYMTVGYVVRFCNGGGSHNHYLYPELSIYQIDPAGASKVVLQVRGARPVTAWISGNDWNPATFNPDPRLTTIVDGYLFKDRDLDGPLGDTVYWGGGGCGNPLTGAAVEEGAPPGELNPVTFTRGTVDLNRYVYQSDNGLDWAPINGGNGLLATDQYGRSFGQAMPNGYRYNHLIEFDGKFWDYYGWYNNTPNFAHTRHLSDGTRDILTEPWSRFQMGAGTIDGTNRLLRVGFNPKSDKNFLYTTTGGNWSKFADAVPGSPNNGSVYWRGCTVIECTDDADPRVLESRHSGLYATYSRKLGAGSYESGVYRYTDHDGDGAWTWHKVTSTADARVYTGAIFSKRNDGVYVGTTGGVIRRGMGPYNDGGTADPLDDTNLGPDL